ncbi:beta-glucosidase [Acidicapsa acidisoli]|uniref:beta-glucosidase n=1 Tax=Acidicapsa acidisoli TaxID=1615681 RepID=UPI0021E0BD12|nr:glycoside hydrolase family 3 C-terminal domain-containing protein [Acidicapsa acidisoli]
MIPSQDPQSSTSESGRKSSRALLFSLLLVPSLALTTVSAFAQDSVPVVTGVPRVDKLLSQMTVDEKMALIRGASEPSATNQGQAGYLTGVPRLGIPSIRMSDGPPGVLTRNPSMAETATMGVAATFSVKDAEQNGEVIAREAKSLGIDVVLEPFINIDRDITFERGYNTEGEDPVLTGVIGASLIQGIQSQGVMSQAKHYVAYDTDGSNVFVDQQALHEIYIAPFIDAVQAGVSSIMCSYNKVNGTQACGNPDMLVKILHDEVGFKGFVTSDWGAVHAANYINNGLDMEMPGPGPKDSPLAGMMYSFFTTEEPKSEPPPKFNTALLAGFLGGTLPEEPKPKPFNFGTIGAMRDAHTNFWNLRKEGKLDDATITRAAGRVLYEIDKFGYLDHPTPGQAGPKEPPVHAVEANAAVIQKTAEDAAVLLKNEDHVLPLKSSETVALIGPGAGQTVSIGTAGERSIGWPWRQIGTVQAIAKVAPEIQVTYAVEDDMTGTPIPASQWTSEDGKPGLQQMTKDGVKSTDAILDFTTKAGTALPANSAMTWDGKLNVPTTGSYWIYLQLLGAAGSIEIDGKRVAGANGMRGGVHGDTVLGGKDGLMPTTDGLDNLRTAVELTAGQHAVKVTIEGDTSNHPAQVRLAWVTPEQRKANHDAAIAAAKAAKTAVVFVWSRGKTDFVLPGNGKDYDQDKLIEEIAAVNPNTVVVLNVSQPIAMPWLSKVKGVLQMWWPGDEGGWATANILAGKTSPAGRLPFTWAKRLEDYPATNPKYPERSSKGVGGKTTFSEGVNVGYRWFDKEKIAPEFPFGFGLSYTTFAYANLKTEPAAEGGIVVEFDVKNTGPVASDEVPQIYLGRPEHKFPGEFPEHALVAFDRIHLDPGESKRVSITVPLRRLQFWSTEASKWTTATGPRAVLVGSSSRSLDLATSIDIR